MTEAAHPAINTTAEPGAPAPRFLDLVMYNIFDIM